MSQRLLDGSTCQSSQRTVGEKGHSGAWSFLQGLSFKVTNRSLYGSRLAQRVSKHATVCLTRSTCWNLKDPEWIFGLKTSRDGGILHCFVASLKDQRRLWLVLARDERSENVWCSTVYKVSIAIQCLMYEPLCSKLYWFYSGTRETAKKNLDSRASSFVLIPCINWNEPAAKGRKDVTACTKPNKVFFFFQLRSWEEKKKALNHWQISRYSHTTHIQRQLSDVISLCFMSTDLTAVSWRAPRWRSAFPRVHPQPSFKSIREEV